MKKLLSIILFAAGFIVAPSAFAQTFTGVTWTLSDPNNQGGPQKSIGFSMGFSASLPAAAVGNYTLVYRTASGNGNWSPGSTQGSLPFGMPGDTSNPADGYSGIMALYTYNGYYYLVEKDTWRSSCTAISQAKMVWVGPAMTVGVSFNVSPTSFTYNGGSQGPNANPNPGGATYSTSGTASAVNAGSYSVQYDGTGSYSGSSGSVGWSIGKANQGSVFISPSSQTISAGGSITFSTGGGSTGNYNWGGSAGASGGGGSKTVSFPSAGTYSVTVQDTGNGNYNASNTATATITVTPVGGAISSISAATTTYNGSAQTPSLSPNPGGATFNWSVSGGTTSTTATNAGTYNIPWSGTGIWTGSGTAPWTINKANQAGVGLSPGSQSVPSGSAITFTSSGGATGNYSWGGSAGASGGGTSKTLSFPTPGTYTVTVQDTGNSNYNASNTAGVTITVTAGPPTAAVSFSANPIFFGQTATVTFTMAQQAPATISSHYAFWDQGNGSYWTGPGYMWNYNSVAGLSGFGANSQNATPNGANSSSKQYNITPSAVGAVNFLSFGYNSDSNYTAWAVGGASCGTLTINKATPSLGGWTNQSRTSAGAFPSAFTATVSNPYSGAVAAPTGAVTYAVVSASGSSPSPTSGVVNAATTFQPGVYTVRASYTGDSNYAPVSADVTFSVIIPPTAVNASSLGNSLVYGQTTTISTTWTLNGNSLLYELIGVNQNVPGATAWGSYEAYYVSLIFSPLNPVTYSFTPANVGSYSFVGRAYTNAVADWGNYGTPLTVNVSKATPTPTFASRTLTPPVPAPTYTITVADLNATFKNPYSVSATAPSGSPTYSIVGPGTAVTPGTVLAVGSAYTIRASYAGDTLYNANSIDAVFTISKANQGTITISPASPTVELTSSQTFTASGGSTGNYVWGGTAGATGGTSTKALTFNTAGTYTVTVQDSGDGSYNPSNTATATVIVKATPPAVNLSVTSLPTIFIGDTITLNIAGVASYGNIASYTWRVTGYTSWATVAVGAPSFNAGQPFAVPAAAAYTLEVTTTQVNGVSSTSTYNFSAIQGLFTRTINARAEPTGALNLWFTTSPTKTQSYQVWKPR